MREKENQMTCVELWPRDLIFYREYLVNLQGESEKMLPKQIALVLSVLFKFNLDFIYVIYTNGRNVYKTFYTHNWKHEEMVDKLKNGTFHENVAAQLKQIFTDIRRGISKRYQT